MIVAIDGPAGAGKSTVARAVAARLGFAYLDTGSLYRGLAAAALGKGVSPSDGPALANLARSLEMDGASGRVSIEGADVTERLRDPDVTASVSEVSAHPEVRAALIPVQRQSVAAGPTVVEGRDIGTVVFPDAQVKIWLTASPRERARRRAREMGDIEQAEWLEEVEKSIVARDQADSERAASPLARAEDAVPIDTSEMAFDAVVERVVELERAGSGTGPGP